VGFLVADEPLWNHECVVALVSKLMGTIVFFKILEDRFALKTYRFDLLRLRNAKLEELQGSTAVVLCLQATELPRGNAPWRHDIFVVFLHYCIVYIAVVVLGPSSVE
jgi:hypothetical protein